MARHAYISMKVKATIDNDLDVVKEDVINKIKSLFPDADIEIDVLDDNGIMILNRMGQYFGVGSYCADVEAFPEHNPSDR